MILSYCIIERQPRHYGIQVNDTDTLAGGVIEHHVVQLAVVVRDPFGSHARKAPITSLQLQPTRPAPPALPYTIMFLPTDRLMLGGNGAEKLHGKLGVCG